jgi:coenzyme PQQ precursor peptide PqqA
MLAVTATNTCKPFQSAIPHQDMLMKKWNKPVIREICVGCEINSYYSGDF